MTTGVLIINTGTPDAPTVEAIRPYLTEFLMDPVIISAPSFIRKHVANHVAQSRPERTVKRYRQFWTPQGSPFMITSLAQRDLLQQALDDREPGAYAVELAMRYGNPSILLGLEHLRAAGCQSIVILPLYPQNVNVCAGTCFKEVHRCLDLLAMAGWEPKVRQVENFHDQPAYRKALAESVRAAWTPKPGSKLVVSFHSTLMKDIDKDPTYLVQATETALWLTEDLGLDPHDVELGFQSRFDSRKWLQPLSDHLLPEMADEGVRDVCVVCPGFVADNLETAIEVNIDLRHIFRLACGYDEGTFTYVPALGTNPGLIQALVEAVVS